MLLVQETEKKIWGGSIKLRLQGWLLWSLGNGFSRKLCAMSFLDAKSGTNQNQFKSSGRQGADAIRGSCNYFSRHLQQRLRQRARRHRGPPGGAKRPPDAKGPQQVWLNSYQARLFLGGDVLLTISWELYSSTAAVLLPRQAWGTIRDLLINPLLHVSALPCTVRIGVRLRALAPAARCSQNEDRGTTQPNPNILSHISTQDNSAYCSFQLKS